MATTLGPGPGRFPSCPLSGRQASLARPLSLCKDGSAPRAPGDRLGGRWGPGGAARALLPTSPPPEGDLGRVLAEPPQLQKSFLLLGLFFCSSRSGSLAVSRGSSDIPEQALSYTAQPWPPGPLPAKDSPGRTELFSPLGVFLPFLENVKQRNGIQKKSISSDGGELCMYSKSIWHKFTEHLLWVGPAALEGIRVQSAPTGPWR